MKCTAVAAATAAAAVGGKFYKIERKVIADFKKNAYNIAIAFAIAICISERYRRIGRTDRRNDRA